MPENVSRNAPCPCGSGKKHKRCCGAGQSEPVPAPAPASEAVETPSRGMTIVANVALVSVFVLIGLFAIRQVGSLDVGFHLKAGEHILAGNGWPRTDPFTYTMNDHPYVDTSWGYQVLIALVRRAADAPGLVVFHLLLVLATFFTIIQTARLHKHSRSWLIALLLAGGLAAEMRFEIRPELVSYLFLSVVLYLLHRRDGGHPTPLWLLPVIHLLWVNMHSLFVLGWGAVACFGAVRWLHNRKVDRSLLQWGAASVLVAFINPYGWRGVWFPFTLTTRLEGDNPFAQSIGEFTSPFNLHLSESFPFYPRLPIMAFLFMAAMTVVALVPLYRRRRYACLLLWGVFFWLAAKMIRNIPILVVGTLPGTLWGLSAIDVSRWIPVMKDWKSKVLPATTGLTLIVTCLLGLRVVHDAYYIGSRRQDRFGWGWNRLTLPIDAVRWIKEKGIAGRPLNHLNFGGYLMWAQPEPVFIDGRLEVVGEAFYAEYRRALAADEALEACVRKYGVRWMIFPYAISERLLGRMQKNDRWKAMYVDAVAVIFVRSDYDVRPTLVWPQRRAVDIGALPGIGRTPRPGALAFWWRGVFGREEFPAEDFNRGLFFYFTKDLARAGECFATAIEKSGGAYYEIYNNLGAVLYHQGRMEWARDCYRIVLRYDPRNALALERLKK